MNQTKTLSEIRKELGISRKAIQGYEKHELISPCGKDKYGHLIYDDKTVERIIRIRFYQKLGFSVKEIKELSYQDDDQLKMALDDKKEETEKMILMLQRRYYLLEYLICETKMPDIEFMYEEIKEEDQ